MKDRKFKRIALISAVLAILLLITGCSFAASNQNEDGALTGEVQVSTEEALRKALKTKDDCTVVLTGEIVVTKELTVNGNKKLSGGSIVMNRRRIGANESVLLVSKGAHLVLDGTTVDGKGVADCITVDAGGELDVQSGSLVYGYPYGLDVSGKVTITDILIDEALHTAVNVAIFGEVDMLGGTISNNLYGISVAVDASMNIADGVTMENSFGSYIINYGDMDIVGGKYVGANENAIENYGKMSIKGTEENPVEFSGGKKTAIITRSKAKLTAENIKIYNMGWHGMCVEKSSTATLKDIYLENMGKSTLYINSSKVTMENVSVIGGRLYAIYATESADVEMHNITVKDTQSRGIMVERSKVNIDGITIDGTAQNGIYTTGDTTVANINNATITNPGTSGIGVAKGKVTVTNSEIGSTTKEGVAVLVNGTVTLESVTIRDNGNFAIGNYGGKVTAKNVEIYNTQNVSIKLMQGCTFTGSKLLIRNTPKQAISVEDGSTAYVSNSNIGDTKMAGVNVDNSYLNMSGTTIKNTGTYGLGIQKNSKAILNNVKVYNAGSHAIGTLNSYVVAKNIKVYNSGRCGMYTEGENARLNMAFVEIYNAGSCGFGFKGGKEITARNVLIENPKNEGIYAFNGANVKKLDNIVIKKPGSHGISVEGGAIVNVTVDTSFNPENTQGNGVTITNPSQYGLRAVGGTIVAKNVTVTNAKYGVNAGKDGSITVKNCVVENASEYGINISAGGTVTVSETVVTNAGKRGVNSFGKLILTPATAGQMALTIDTAADHGIYLGASANVEGAGLIIKNVGNNAIFSEGADITVDGLTVANTSKQGIQLKGGTVTLSNINFEGVGQATVYVRNNTKLTLTGGTIQAYSYGLAITDSAEVIVKNVTIEKSAKGGAYSTNALINAEKNSKVDLQSGTKLDGKGKAGDGVNVVTSTTAVILNGATFANIPDGNAAVYLKGSNTTIKLQKALNEEVSLKLGAYTEGLLVAEKSGEISDAEFKASSVLLAPIDTNWIVTDAGCLSKPGDVVATIGNTTYTSLEAAIAAANASEGADTIKLLCDVTIAAQLSITSDITITADKAVTITAESALNNYMFEVAAGKTLTIQGAASAKIAIMSVSTTKEVFYNQGKLNMTDVSVSGGKYAVNNRADSTLNLTNVTIKGTANNGLHLAGGTTTVTNVTISKVSGHGIGCYAELVLQPAEAGQTALTIDGEDTTGHGLYVDWNGVVRGFGLEIRNTQKCGIFGNNSGNYNGINVEISDLQIENVGEQGVQVKRGTATISDFTIKDTGSAAVYSLNSVKLALSDGTIYANTYGVAMASSTEVVLDNVTLEKTGSDTSALVDIAGNAKLEIAGTTKIDGKNTGVAGVNVASTATFTINGGNVTGADVVLASGAVIQVKSALTSNISVKPATYAEGTVIAQNAGGVAGSDFEESMALLIPADANWIVDSSGKLAKAVCEHVWSEPVVKEPTCTETGVKTYTCTACGSTYSENIAIAEHTVTRVEAVAPTAETDGNIAYWKCTTCNTLWEDEAKTKEISLEDVVLEAGSVAYMNGEAYKTLEAAVTAANNTPEADTILLLRDLEISAQLAITTDITITADKAVTVQVADKVTGSVIYVTSGSLTITGASEDAKITIAASTKSQSMVKMNGGDVNLTNVHLQGNTASTVAVKNGNCIQNEKGTLTAKNVILENCTGDGIRVYAGATANVDNVTISGAGKYGVNILGTLDIYNTANAENALTVNNTKDHGIRVEGKVESHLNNVPEGTYAINAHNNGGRGIVVVKGSATLTNVSVKNSKDYGVDVYAAASIATISDFEIVDAAKGVNVVGTATLTNGSISANGYCVYATAGSNLTATNVTVQRTTEGDALSINGATSYEGITVITEEQNG